jgi:hypothetical protein
MTIAGPPEMQFAQGRSRAIGENPIASKKRYKLCAMGRLGDARSRIERDE